MAMKDFDFKQFLMAKGERVGLYAAGGLGLFLVVAYNFLMAGTGLRSPSARESAQEITKIAGEKDGLLSSNKPSADEVDRMKNVDPRLMTRAANPTQDPDDFRVAEVFTGAANASTKRRKPNVYAPEEFRATVALTQVRAHMFVNDPNGATKVGVLTGKTKGSNFDAKATHELAKKFFNKRAGTFRPGLPALGGGAGMLGGGAGMPPGGDGGMAPGGGAGLGGGPGGVGGGPGGLGGGAGITGTAEVELKYVLTEELAKTPGELAETLDPRRIAIIAASFPYKQQVEEFKRALRLTSLGQVLQETYVDDKDGNVTKEGFKFLGFNVERRAVRPDGTVSDKDWVRLNLDRPDSPYVDLVLRTGKNFEYDNAEMFPLLIDGLAMGRPRQIAKDNYPDIETKLPKIQQVLKDIKEKRRPVPVGPNPRFDPSGFNPFSNGRDGGGLGTGTGMDGAGGAGGMMPPGAGGAGMAPGGGGAGMRPPGGGGMAPPGGGGMLPPGGGGMMPPGAGRGGAGMRPPVGGGGGMVPPGAGGPGEGGEGYGGTDWDPVDYGLLRFLDVSIEPGKAYEYRIQVKMANPNYGKTKDVAFPALAENRELEGEWVDVKDEKGQMIRVSAPRDFFYYAVDQRKIDTGKYKGMNSNLQPRPDQTVIQIHRWIDVYFPTVQQNYFLPVGDWMVAERVFINKGEHIGQTVPLKLPVWAPEQRKFTLAVKPGGSPKRLVDKIVDLSFGSAVNLGPILVDFEGGPSQPLVHTRLVPKGEGLPPARVTIPAGENSAELLLMTPDGRLIGRNPALDEKDQTRVDRHKLWMDKTEQVEKDKYDPGRMFNPGGGDGGLDPFGSGSGSGS